METSTISLILGLSAALIPFLGQFFGMSAYAIAISEFVDTPIGSFFIIWPLYTMGIITIQVAALLLFAAAFIFFYCRGGSALKIVTGTVILWILMSCAMFYDELPEIFDNYIGPLLVAITIASFLTFGLIYFILPAICTFLGIDYQKIIHSYRMTSYRNTQYVVREHPKPNCGHTENGNSDIKITE